MEGGLRASEVLSRPVCFRDIRLGVVVDLVLDDGARRVLGFDVLGGDRVHRFLPLAACELREETVRVGSALVLMAQELEFYRQRGRALTALRGFPVRRGGRSLGILADVSFGPEGDLVGLSLDTEEGVSEIAPGDSLLLGRDPLRPAV